MARLKLQSTWEEARCKRTDNGFLADLVRAARHADRALDEVDVYTSFHETSKMSTASPTNGGSSPSSPKKAEKRSALPPQSSASMPRSARSQTPRTKSGGASSSSATGSAGGRAVRTAAGILSTPRHPPLSRQGVGKLLDTFAISGEITRGCSPAVSRIPIPAPATRKNISDVPAWFRSDGVPAPLHSDFLPEYSLWVTLHGGNGTWKQRDARAEWERQVKEFEVSKREWALREERERARLIEAERRRKAEAEEEERRAAEAEAERRRKREEEERRLMEAEMRRREKLAEAERERQRRLPRPCTVCDGTGHCSNCGGRGFNQTMYLSQYVRAQSAVTGAHLAGGQTSGAATVTNIATNSAGPSGCGRLPRGCETCGGWGDGADWGEFTAGTGRCNTCNGTGKIQAPKGGWPI